MNYKSRNFISLILFLVIFTKKDCEAQNLNTFIDSLGWDNSYVFKDLFYNKYIENDSILLKYLSKSCFSDKCNSRTDSLVKIDLWDIPHFEEDSLNRILKKRYELLNVLDIFEDVYLIGKGYDLNNLPIYDSDGIAISIKSDFVESILLKDSLVSADFLTKKAEGLLGYSYVNNYYVATSDVYQLGGDVFVFSIGKKKWNLDKTKTMYFVFFTRNEYFCIEYYF